MSTGRYQKDVNVFCFFSNDTDTLALLLRYIDIFERKGLKELWIRFGKGETKRMIPLHKIKESIGNELSQSIIKLHVLTGCDTTSKIGTKHAALDCNPLPGLSQFAEAHILTESEILLAEEYLVRVWVGARSKNHTKTFDELRAIVKNTSSKGLDGLPPTSSVVRGHLKRCFYVLRNALTLLGNPSNLDPTDYCWFEQDGTFLPEKCMKEFSETLLKLCTCGGKCETKKCSCMKLGMKCVVYCHKNNLQSVCINH